MISISGQTKAEAMTRFIAALVDGFIAALVFFIPVIGAVVSTGYLLVKDGLFQGQSIGKRLLKIQVVTAEGEDASFAVSAKRNAIFALPALISIVPSLLWLLFPLISLVIVAAASLLAFIIIVVEVVKVLNEPEGRRLGDTWAETRVVKLGEEVRVS